MPSVPQEKGKRGGGWGVGVGVGGGGGIGEGGGGMFLRTVMHAGRWKQALGEKRLCGLQSEPKVKSFLQG